MSDDDIMTVTEDIRMVFFDEREFAKKLSMVHRFIEEIVRDDKTIDFDYTELIDYSVGFTGAWKGEKTIWGETFNHYWEFDSKPTMLMVQMKLFTNEASCSWFEDIGGPAFVDNDNQITLTLSDVAKNSDCALDITCMFAEGVRPTSSEREIYMPDGSKVLSETTDWYKPNKNVWKWEMKNPDFGKTQFIDIIEKHYEKIAVEIDLKVSDT